MVDDAFRQVPATDRAAPQPLYHQVETAIRKRIISGDWSPGTKIPPEDQLCEQFQVSSITIRHALRNLVAQGLLERERGRGTFVRDTTLTAGARGLTSFSTEMQELGLKAGSRTISTEVTAVPSDVADALEIEHDTPVVAIRRLRTGDGLPLGLQTAYLPAERFPGLEDEMLQDRSLYAVLREKYGVTPVEAIETFRVARVAKPDAALLEVSAGDCAFAVERITSDTQRPFECVRSIMRGDHYQVRLALRNP